MQNSKELITNMFSKADIDRIGIYDGFWAETLDRWIGEGYPTDELRGDGKTYPVDPFLYFEFDLHKCGGFFDTQPQFGNEEIIEQTDDWIVKRNGAGATVKSWIHNTGVPQQLGFEMRSREIWERDYKPHLLKADRRRFNGKWWEAWWGARTLEDDLGDLEIAREREQWTWYGHNFLWSILRATIGDLDLLRALRLDPGWIKDFNATYTAFYKEHFEILFSENGLPDGIWIFDDLAYKERLFCSPEILCDLFLPFYAELNQFFGQYNLPVIFHSDGNIHQALPMIVESGFSALNPMEVKAGCDLLAIAREYKDDLVLIGGFDVRIMETNDRATIEREMVALFQSMKEIGARYVFGSDHTVSSDVSFDTYRHILDIFDAHRMY
jgi:uroporphyrinogen decarboxylase